MFLDEESGRSVKMQHRTVPFTLHHGVALNHKNNLNFIKIMSFKKPRPLCWGVAIVFFGAGGQCPIGS